VDTDAVPVPLRTRLGFEATVGLVELLDLSQREAREAVIAVGADRFERRLVEEVSGLRVEIARVESTLRQDMVQLGAGLRQEMAEMRADLRQEMAEMRADLRQEMAEMRAGLRQEMGEMRAGLRQEIGDMGAGLRGEIATGRVELFKWCFLFWIGQVLAIGGLMGVMLRLIR
jgi:hypothetical protein